MSETYTQTHTKLKSSDKELIVFPEDLVPGAELVEDIYNQRGDILISARKLTEKEISLIQEKIINQVDLYHKDKEGNLFPKNALKVLKSDEQLKAIQTAVKEGLIFKFRKIVNSYKLKVIEHIKIVLEDLGYQRVKENVLFESTTLDIVVEVNDKPLIVGFALDGDIVKENDISFYNRTAKEFGARYSIISNGIRDWTYNVNKGVEHKLPKYEDVASKSILKKIKNVFLKPKKRNKLTMSIDDRLKERASLIISKIIKQKPEFEEPCLFILDYLANLEFVYQYLYELKISKQEYNPWVNHIFNVLILSVIMGFLMEALDEQIAEVLAPATVLHDYYLTERYKTWTIADDIETKEEQLEYNQYPKKSVTLLEGKPGITPEILEIIENHTNPQEMPDNTFVQILAIADALERLIRGRGKKKNDSYGLMGIPAALKRLALFAQKDMYDFTILDKLAEAYGEMLPHDIKTQINKIVNKCEFKFARQWFPWGYPHKIICSGNGPEGCKILESMGTIRVNHKSIGPKGEYMVCGVLTKEVRSLYKEQSFESEY